MEKIRLLTWNVNSIRKRIDLIDFVSKELNPDIVCLQETKVKNEEFPHLECNNIGFPYIKINGMSGYNGVAVLSKIPIDDCFHYNFCNTDDSRHLAVVIKDVEIHNLYVPAGGYEPDIDNNPKFLHKLNFLEDMKQYFVPKCLEKTNQNKGLIVVGDLNVAPLPNDVYNHNKMLRTVSHTIEETSRLDDVMNSAHFVDIERSFVPHSEQLFTWWSYRIPAWEAKNYGRRLDHIWSTSNFAQNFTSMNIFKTTRSLQNPSDHIPVIADFMIDV